MGSHPWKAITDYRPDVSAALVQAQAATFSRGEYGQAHKLRSAYAAMGMPVPDLPPEPQAASIDEARRLGAESGTCSILDVYDVAESPGLGVTGPFSASLLRQHFGTDQPTIDQVEEGLTNLYEHLDRGESGFVVCYEDETPARYLFIGMSFD